MRLSKARFIVLAVFLLALQPVTHAEAAGAGRDAARCFQASHQIRVACDERCDEICLSMYPGDDEKYVDCLSTGKAICLDYEQEHRQVCQNFKSGEPIEP